MFLKLKNWIILSKLSAIIIFLIFNQVVRELHEMLRSPVETHPGPSDHLFITIFPSPASLPCKKNSNSSESALKKVESLMAR